MSIIQTGRIYLVKGKNTISDKVKETEWIVKATRRDDVIFVDKDLPRVFIGEVLYYRHNSPEFIKMRNDAEIKVIPVDCVVGELVEPVVDETYAGYILKKW